MLRKQFSERDPAQARLSVRSPHDEPTRNNQESGRPVLLDAQGVRALQRLAGNRATAAIVQRGLDAELKTARDAVSSGARSAVEKHMIRKRSTPHTEMIAIWNHVRGRETGWTQRLQEHIFKGEPSGSSVAGYHSTADDSAIAEGVGSKNPANVSARRPYKQNVRLRTDTGNRHLKSHASTFFPDDWSKEKVRASYLLSGSTGQVSPTDAGVTELGGGTAFPADVRVADPPR